MSNYVKKKVNERFQYFSIILNVREGEDTDWLSLTKEDMVDHKFPNVSGFSDLYEKFLFDTNRTGNCENFKSNIKLIF